MVLTISKSFLCLALLAGSAAAQKYTPPPPPLTSGPCVPTKKSPCDPPPAPPKTPAAADANPFPGESTESKPDAASQNPFPGEAGTKPPPPGAAAQNPFPGEPEAPKPAAPGAASQNPFPGEQESSSASGSSTADSAPDPEATPSNKPLTRTQRRHLAKVEDIDHRELEDLDISKYYISTGDFRAAYLRAKDAVAMIPDDPDAHFALGVAAASLKNADEAMKEYKTYLDMDSEGIHAKAARKALAAMPVK